MSLGMPGDVKRVGETRYTPRVREAALNQERADEQIRLAALEDHVRRQRKHAPKDTVELKSSPEKDASGPPTAPAKNPAEKKPAEKKAGEHLDITV